MVEQRKKEIAVRKVIGASIFNVVRHLSKEFLTLIIFANITAIPIAYYCINKWLQNFAYRLNVGFWLYILPGIFVLVIAIITISLKTLNAARMNPVDLLKHE